MNVTIPATSGKFDSTSKAFIDAATNKSYVNMGGKNSYLDLSINAPNAGNYTLGFEYVTPSKDRPCVIVVNGKQLPQTIKFPDTQGVLNWRLQATTVTLKAGSNLIRLLASTDAGGPNVSTLSVSDAPATAPPATAPHPTVPKTPGTAGPSSLNATNTGVEIGLRGKLTPTPTGAPTLNQTTLIVGRSYTGGDLDVELPAGATATLRNCVFDGGNAEPYGISALKNLGTVILENCEIKNLKADGLIGQGIVLKRCHIHHCAGDCFKPTHNVHIIECFLEEVGFDAPLAHADNVQLINATDVEIRGCRMESVAKTVNGETFKGNTCVQLQGKCDNIVIDGNLMICSGTAIHAWPEDGKLTVTNNDITTHLGLSIDPKAVVSGNVVRRTP